MIEPESSDTEVSAWDTGVTARDGFRLVPVEAELDDLTFLVARRMDSVKCWTATADSAGLRGRRGEHGG